MPAESSTRPKHARTSSTRPAHLVAPRCRDEQLNCCLIQHCFFNCFQEQWARVRRTSWPGMKGKADTPQSSSCGQGVRPAGRSHDQAEGPSSTGPLWAPLAIRDHAGAAIKPLYRNHATHVSHQVLRIPHRLHQPDSLTPFPAAPGPAPSPPPACGCPCGTGRCASPGCPPRWCPARPRCGSRA